MSLSPPLRYAATCGAAAVAGAVAGLGLAGSVGWPVTGWSLFGWVLATSLGTFCGARLESLHGRPGSAFLIAHGSCILARLFTFAGGAAWAVSHSMQETWSFLAGVVAGYLPIQVLELVWFARRTKDRNS